MTSHKRRSSAGESTRGIDDVALRASNIRDHAAVADDGGGLGKKPQVLLDRRSEDDEVVAGKIGDTLSGAIDRAAPGGMRQHRRPIDRGDANRRPAVTNGANRGGAAASAGAQRERIARRPAESAHAAAAGTAWAAHALKARARLRADRRPH